MYTKRTKIIGGLLAIIMLLQVFCSSITSVVLATETGNGLIDNQEGEVPTNPEEGESEEPEDKEEEESTEKTIAFVDENLYKAIKEQVKEKLMSYSDKDRTMTISNVNIEEITSLNLSKKEIKDLTGLEYFTGLTSLDLTSNKIKSIDKLSALTNLQELHLANNNIEDCTPLESLVNLNKEKLTVGSQDLEKSIIVNYEDISNGNFKYSLPQIFSYIRKAKVELGESINLGTPVIEGKDTELKEKINRASVNEEIFEVQVNNVKDKYQGYVHITYEYRTATGLGTKLALRLLVVNDKEKQGILFEDSNLYKAVKANIEGTLLNGYTDSKYPTIRDDNDGCIWYDSALGLVINRYYLYKDITELDLVNKKIENLEGLQYFAGLSDLDLSNNFISDVSKFEEFIKQKEVAEADLKEKVKEKYEDIKKNIDKKEKALSLLTLSGRKSAITKVISEIKSYISDLSEEDLDEETKKELNDYFLNEIDVDCLAAKDIEDDDDPMKENISDLINGREAVIGKNKIDDKDKDCIITINGSIIEYNIAKSPQNADGTISGLPGNIVDYIINKFKVIQKINNGYCEVDGELIDGTEVLANSVEDIEDDIEDLEKYVDIEDLLLILTKETINLTAEEIDALTLEETRKLAEDSINAIKGVLNTLTAEELNVAFDFSITDLDSYNDTIDVIKKSMNKDLKSITDEDDENYIGDNKNKLQDIIFNYISYQLCIIESRNDTFLGGIYIGKDLEVSTGEGTAIQKYSPIEILIDEDLEYDDIMDYDVADLGDFPVSWLKPRALDIINAFIEADKDNKIPDDAEEWIKDFPTLTTMQEEYNKVRAGTSTGYKTSSNLASVITKYINYNNILSKEVMSFTSEEFELLTFERLKELTLQIIDKYIDSYDEFSTAEIENTDMKTKSEMQGEYNKVEAETSSYDSISELTKCIKKYIEYQNGINEVYTENFGESERTYANYIKAAILEDDTSKNYMDSDIADKYKLDQSDVKNIIARFKGVNFDEIISLPKIKVLNLSSNNLTDISELTGITSLVELYLSDNLIRDLSKIDFSKLEKLAVLDLSHNRIYEAKISFAPIATEENKETTEEENKGTTTEETEGTTTEVKSPRLKHLDLAYNYLENISGMNLGSFIKLQTLNLAGNRIYDLQNIMYNLHLIANYQLDNELVPIINYAHDNAHILSTTKVEECGYIVEKGKVNFENQIIYASVPELVLQGSEEYVKLPEIFNQVKYIDCGETNFLNAKATNDGMITYLETARLGEQTEAAYIQGTGVATGTVCYITYNVGTEEEVKTIPVQNILIQEEVVLEDENGKRPDLNGDGKVTTEDMNLLKNGIAQIIELTEAQKKVSDIVPDNSLDINDVLLLEQIIKASWHNSKLTLEQRERSSNADVDGNKAIDEEDLRLFALHIIGNKNVTGNFAQDINGDEQVDIKDVILLSKYVASKSTERRNTDAVTISILNQFKETKQLHANIIPEDATNKDVTWISNNENIVKVDATGKLTAVGEGTTTVNVASKSNTNVYKTIRVDVVKAVNIVEEIRVVEPQEGETGMKTEYYVTEPLDLTNAKIEVLRRDGSKEIVDITEEMLEGFTTEEEGIKVVTVTYEDVTTTFEVTVTEYSEPKIDLTADHFDVKLPENAIYNGEKYLAEVALKEGVKAGELTVKYRDTEDNPVEEPINAGTYKVSVEVTKTVYADAKIVELGEFTIAQAQLTDDVIPSIARKYIVEKDGTFGITTKDGKVSLPEGTVFDTVGSFDIELTYTPNDTNYAPVKIPVKVDVVISVTGVSLNKAEYTIVKGGEVTIIATVMPESATNKNITWKSSDETIATVDDSGTVTAIAVGQVTISATTKDGEKVANCKIVVKEQEYKVNELEDGTAVITGVNPDTTEKVFRDKLLSENNYKLFKADGTTELTDTDTIATGYLLKVYDANGTVVEEQILVVKGDTNGDGKASATDSGAILAHRTGKALLKDQYLFAADINNDGTVDGRDSTLLIYHRIGMAGYILQNN